MAQSTIVWKTIALGGACKTPGQYHKALTGAGRRISARGNDMLDRIFCLQWEIEVDLVKMSVAELGFEDGALHADICAKALKLALELCPAEVGLALRLQYGDQLDGERLRIGMRPLVDHGGIFSVDNENGRLWLSDSWGRSGFYSADYCFVFVVPQI